MLKIIKNVHKEKYMYNVSDIKNYIVFLKTSCGLYVTLHPTSNESLILPSELITFNIHDNPYCIYVKSFPQAHKHCVDCQQKIAEIKAQEEADRLERERLAEIASIQLKARTMRKSMKIWMIICFVFASIYALMAFVSIEIVFMTVFFGILGVMFLVLGYSPKERPFLFGKTSGISKKRFVIFSVIAAFAACYIVLFATMPPQG